MTGQMPRPYTVCLGSASQGGLQGPNGTQQLAARALHAPLSRSPAVGSRIELLRRLPLVAPRAARRGTRPAASSAQEAVVHLRPATRRRTAVTVSGVEGRPRLASEGKVGKEGWDELTCCHLCSRIDANCPARHLREVRSEVEALINSLPSERRSQWRERPMRCSGQSWPPGDRSDLTAAAGRCVGMPPTGRRGGTPRGASSTAVLE